MVNNDIMQTQNISVNYTGLEDKYIYLIIEYTIHKETNSRWVDRDGSMYDHFTFTTSLSM